MRRSVSRASGMTNSAPPRGDATGRTRATRPVKHSFTIAGHRTSISLEQAFWDVLREAAAAERVPLAELVRRIDRTRGDAGLSGAVRVWILDYLRGGNRETVRDAG